MRIPHFKTCGTLPQMFLGNLNLISASNGRFNARIHPQYRPPTRNNSVL